MVGLQCHQFTTYPVFLIIIIKMHLKRQPGEFTAKMFPGYRGWNPNAGPQAALFFSDEKKSITVLMISPMTTAYFAI